MTARWQATHAYTAGTIILPTVDNGRCFYCTTGGTSGATEPAWPARYPAVTDGSAAWAPYTVVQPSVIRTLQGWDDTTNRYSDDVLGNYLLDSIAELERATRRCLVNQPGRILTWTSMLRAEVPIPGLRTATTVVYAGTTLDSNGYWLLPDAMQSGVFTAIQFRAFRSTESGPWWLADSLWFDKALDSPFNPGNYGGGYVFTSMPNDMSVTGDWGYAPGSEPADFVSALQILASFHQQRPVSLLADSVITPQGGVLSFSQMPTEVRTFIAQWSTGQQVVSVG